MSLMTGTETYRRTERSWRRTLKHRDTNALICVRMMGSASNSTPRLYEQRKTVEQERRQRRLDSDDAPTDTIANLPYLGWVGGGLTSSSSHADDRRPMDDNIHIPVYRLHTDHIAGWVRAGRRRTSKNKISPWTDPCGTAHGRKTGSEDDEAPRRTDFTSYALSDECIVDEDDASPTSGTLSLTKVRRDVTTFCRCSGKLKIDGTASSSTRTWEL